MSTSNGLQAAQAARRHWRVSLGAACCVLLLSATVSFVPPMLAYRLHPVAADVTIAGTPWPYFIGAQGAVLVFVLLVVGYTMVMSRADRRYRETMRRIADAEGELAVSGAGNDAGASAESRQLAPGDGAPDANGVSDARHSEAVAAPGRRAEFRDGGHDR